MENMIGKTIELLNLPTMEQTKMKFMNSPKEDVILYHFSLGRMIRNYFQLNEREWEPMIINGVDHSPNHPDQVSMSILYSVWEKLNQDK